MAQAKKTKEPVVAVTAPEKEVPLTKKGKPRQTVDPSAPKPKGRPKGTFKPIDKEQFENLCAMQCTLMEMCDWFGVCHDTLEDWCKREYDGKNFSEVFEEKRGKGKISLRRAQFMLAQKNAAMAIFLGKNYLDQKDDPTKDINADEDKPYSIDSLLIADCFHKLHRDIMTGAHTEYVLKGGRGSTKSSFISIQGIELLLNNPQINWLVLRKVGNTLRDSVYNQVVWAIDKLGLTEQFTFRTAPLEITYKKTGQKIYFRGADDPVKIKSIKPANGYIGLLWFEELDQFRGEEEVRNIIQSALRGGDKATIFMSFNPPKTINNWANQFVIIPKENRVVHDSNYLEVPPEWLGKVFLDEAEFLKEINPKAYEHEYMGVAVGTGGNVFDNVRCEEITDDTIKHYDNIYFGLDFGWYPDPLDFVKCYYNPANLTLYIFDEFRAQKLSNRELGDELLKRNVGVDDIITCDSAEPKSISDLKSYGFCARGAKKGPGSITYSMKWLQSLRAIVIDPARCPNAAKEFLNYEYEQDKDGNVISSYPDKDNHSIDAVRYAMESVWKRRGE